MLSNIFKWVSAIPRITRILSNSKVQVRYKGDGAYTSVDSNGKPVLINLPSLPDNITQKHLDLTFGFMFHELGHVNHTDFSITRKNKVDISSGVGQIFNIIEDAYIEKVVSSDYLEAKQYLLHCQQYILDYTIAAIANPNLSKEEKALAILIPKIRYLAGQNTFAQLISSYPMQELEFLDKYEEELKNVSSTQESYELAVKIYKQLKRRFNFSKLPQNSGTNKDSQNQQQKTGKSGDTGKSNEKENSNSDKKSGGSDSSDKNSNDKNSKNDSSKGQEKNDESGKPNKSDESQDKDKDKNNANGNSGGSEDESDASGDDEEKLTQALAEAIANSDAFKEIRAKGTSDKTNKIGVGGDASGDNKPSGPCIILKDFNDKVYSVVNRSEDGFWEVPSEYNSYTVESMTPNVSILGMKQKLLRLFAAKTKKSIIKGVRSGKLCNNNLFRLRLNDDRVFKKNYENTQLNTAITLLIDCSGSMSGGRDQRAISAAYLFARILEHLNIPCEVQGFSTGSDSFGGDYGRRTSVKNAIFKRFNEKLTPKIVGRFCYFYNGRGHSNYYNCNDDGESILLALSNLANRPEERKMMFVMSDGQPNVGGCNGEECNHLRDVVKNIEETSGFEIYGIGIQTSAVKKYYSNYSVLDNPEDLSKIIIQQLSKNIL